MLESLIRKFDLGRLESPLIRRALFLGITAGCLYGLYLAVVAPLLGILADQRDEGRQLGLQLSHLQVLVDRQGEVDAIDIAGIDAAFLPGDSEGAASANLQAELKQFAEKAGAQVQSVQALEPRDMAGTRYLGAHLVVNGRIATIHAAVGAIEQALPYLFVTALAIRAPATTGGAAPTEEASLDVQLDVYGATHASHAP